ncbi:MAG: pyridoxamine 5'-phosphate oxidase family protein [Propionibacteriales bacterium]|nr:pyridoxamine 5'-phosphate oxidase family protein [Propionibacteriales bacterium]
MRRGGTRCQQTANGERNVFRELSQQECAARLRGSGVGRVAVCTPDGPVIIPVNYVIDEGTVVVRTAPYTLLAGHAWDKAAFEIDELDHNLRRGWSVLVVGQASPVEDVDEVQDSRTVDQLTTWAPGSRSMFIRITPVRITGRVVAS